MPKSKLQKQKESEERAKTRAKRSNKDQISHLDSLFGAGQCATKERAKLLTRIEQERKPRKEEASSEEKPKKTRKKKD
jgi:hypothetical protein